MDLYLIISGITFLTTDIGLFIWICVAYFLKVNQEKLRTDSISEEKESVSESQYLVYKDSTKNDIETSRDNNIASLFFLLRGHLSFTLFGFYTYLGMFLTMGLDVLTNASTSNKPLYRIYLILFTLAIVFLLVYMILELVHPLTKQLKLYQGKSQEISKEPFKFSYVTNYLKRTPIRRVFSLISVICSFSFFVSSQVLIWGFVYF